MTGKDGWTWVKYKSTKCFCIAGSGSCERKSSSVVEEPRFAPEGSGGHTPALGKRQKKKKKLVIKHKNGNEGHGNSPYATLVPAINPVFISQQVQATSFAVIPHLLFFVQAQLASGSCEIFL